MSQCKKQTSIISQTVRPRAVLPKTAWQSSVGYFTHTNHTSLYLSWDMNLEMDPTANLGLDQSDARSSVSTRTRISIKQLAWALIRGKG